MAVAPLTAMPPPPRRPPQLLGATYRQPNGAAREGRRPHAAGLAPEAPCALLPHAKPQRQATGKAPLLLHEQTPTPLLGDTYRLPNNAAREKRRPHAAGLAPKVPCAWACARQAATPMQQRRSPEQLKSKAPGCQRRESPPPQLNNPKRPRPTIRRPPHGRGAARLGCKAAPHTTHPPAADQQRLEDPRTLQQRRSARSTVRLAPQRAGTAGRAPAEDAAHA